MAHLEGLNHQLLRHNYHLGFIEIDLITQDLNGIIHFVEVKSWLRGDDVHPLVRLPALQWVVWPGLRLGGRGSV